MKEEVQGSESDPYSIRARRVRHAGLGTLKKNPAPGRVLPDTPYGFRQLFGFQVAGRQFAALRDDIKADALAVRQRIHAGSLDRADVHENVLIAAFRLNKPKSLAGIEKLDSSNSHIWPPLQKAAHKSGAETNNLRVVSDLERKPGKRANSAKTGQNKDRGYTVRVIPAEYKESFVGATD